MLLVWVGFLGLIVALLALDLGVLNRDAHVISTREALGWTGFWIALALVFNGFLYFAYQGHWLGLGTGQGQVASGMAAAEQFLAGYLIEKSLSLDNIFVIAAVFSYFGVPRQFQHRVLFWGILGALLLRGVMIAAGLAVLGMFTWVTYVFGGVLLLSAAKLLRMDNTSVEPERNPMVRLVRRWMPVTTTYHEQRFFVHEGGRRVATPLLLALVVVESMDVMFAVDSIPAVFAVTLDPFIVFTSNVFAILGLRSLYFALAAMMHQFRYLQVSLVFVLAFVGVKMLLAHHYPIPTLTSLSVIAGLLLVGVLASLALPQRDPAGPTTKA